MTIQASRHTESSWKPQAERDPFYDASHVANGIHSPQPLAREVFSGFETEPKSHEVRVLELGAVSLDASVQSVE